MPSFLDLSAELKNRIYTDVLIFPLPIELRANHCVRKDDRDGIVYYGNSLLLTGARHTALTRVCRQIRADTLPIFFGANTFRFTPRSYCSEDGKTWCEDENGLCWVESLSEEAVGWIRRIYYRTGARSRHRPEYEKHGLDDYFYDGSMVIDHMYLCDTFTWLIDLEKHLLGYLTETPMPVPTTEHACKVILAFLERFMSYSIAYDGTPALTKANLASLLKVEGEAGGDIGCFCFGELPNDGVDDRFYLSDCD